ncbi:MAG: hypothetical protein RIT27_1491 [Pseudomonadota bacterium]|jgi:hypothetical protein
MEHTTKSQLNYSLAFFVVLVAWDSQLIIIFIFQLVRSIFHSNLHHPQLINGQPIFHFSFIIREESLLGINKNEA